MQKLVGYLAILFVGLVLFPTTMQAVHELTEHHEVSHCDDNVLHFCGKHENCSICSFVFSPSLPTENRQFQLTGEVVVNDRVCTLLQFPPNTHSAFYFSLRAPPVVA